MLQKVSCVERACLVLSFILGLPAPWKILPSAKEAIAVWLEFSHGTVTWNLKKL